MTTLNLVDLNQSDIKYKISKFPDGQHDITILEFPTTPDMYKGDNSVRIKSRFNNFEDLEVIICATMALRNMKIKSIYLYVPYVMGLRSDRLFVKGGTRYIKDVISPIINHLDFETVTCYDAHSDVAQNCIDNLINIDNSELVKWVLNQLVDKRVKEGKSTYLSDCVLVSPDAGASKKIYKVADSISYTGDIIICSKHRDENGKLSRTEVPINKDTIKDKDLVLVDDICDGGATFLNIAKEIKAKCPTNKLYLIVTHGIFSKKFDELNKYFDGIYSTNSYSDIITTGSNSVSGSEKLKQLNVF